MSNPALVGSCWRRCCPNMRFWGLTGHRAQVGAGGAASGHSQPHPRPALDPLPIKPDLSGVRWRVRRLSKLLASIWAHSTWGLEWDVGCGTSRPEGRACVWGINSPSRGLWRAAPCAERSQPRSSCQAALSTMLLSWVSRASCLSRPGGGKQPQGSVLSPRFPHTCPQPCQETLLRVSILV